MNTSTARPVRIKALAQPADATTLRACWRARSKFSSLSSALNGKNRNTSDNLAKKVRITPKVMTMTLDRLPASGNAAPEMGQALG